MKAGVFCCVARWLDGGVDEGGVVGVMGAGAGAAARRSTNALAASCKARRRGGAEQEEGGGTGLCQCGWS